MFGQSWHHGFTIMTANVCSNARQELLAVGGFGHALNITAHQLHGVATVRAQQRMAVIALGRRTVNDGYEISGDDDSVLAFLRGVLGNERLFDYFHGTDKNCWDDEHFVAPETLVDYEHLVDYKDHVGDRVP